jgi:hypothetical protein
LVVTVVLVSVLGHKPVALDVLSYDVEVTSTLPLFLVVVQVHVFALLQEAKDTAINATAIKVIFFILVFFYTFINI